MPERARILAVDDTEAKRYAIVRILRRAGFEVEEASSGLEALTRAHSKPDLIVLDVKLPDLNGVEVCRRLRQDPQLASIPVLHVSASYTATADRVVGLDAGADAYMIDPVEPTELVAMVNALLRARRAEEQARTTARQWQTTFDALRDGVCVTSTGGKILEANRALGELLDQAPDALRDRLLAHRFREAFNVEPPAPLTPDGTARAQEVDVGSRWLRVRCDPVRNESGEIVGAIHIIADVTAEKRAEETRVLVDIMRRKSEERQRFLAEASRILSSSLEPEATLGNIARMVIPRLADWTAIDVLESGELKRIAVTHFDPEKHALAEELLRRWPADPEASKGVAQVLRTGESVFVPTNTAEVFAAMRDPERAAALQRLGMRSYMVVPLVARGAVFGALSLVSESDGLYTEEDLAFAEELGRRAGLAIENARLYSEAQGAVRAREDVLAFVSHDLKNPLTSIVMNATLLKRATPDGSSGDKLRRHSDMIARAAERMNRLVHDLLDWASLRAGRLSLVTTDIDVASLLQESVNLLQSVATSKNQTVTVDAAADLVIAADRDRLLRVLSNLVGNALKYTPEGSSITVRGAQHREELVVSVIDTGPGIPAGEVDLVFDRFFRAKQAGAEGTGLGLAIAKAIVEAHGGRIWAESVVGVGSTFAFALPGRRA